MRLDARSPAEHNFRFSETLFELIKQSLQNGEDVLISGFGKFSVKEKRARRGTNPQTGKPMRLPAGKGGYFQVLWCSAGCDEKAE